MIINNYLKEIKSNLDNKDFALFSNFLKKEFVKTKKKNGKVIILGNGGSASTANHVTVDLTKNANIRAINFNEANLITCFSNDFGYEKWMESSLKYYCDKKSDFVVFLSVSGNSENLVNSLKWCKKNNVNFSTLTGCNKNNRLNKMSKNKNYWVDSSAYNIVEIIHHSLLLMVVDLIIGKSVYKPN
jgi:D-sedoheptulose 7-phosphate isomerase